MAERTDAPPLVSGATRPGVGGGSRRDHRPEVSGATGSDRRLTPPPDDDGVPLVFAAMPFDPAYDDVFFVAIRRAAESVGARAVRVDYVMHAGDAVQETERLLRRCAVVVADLSTNEADVLYEVGYASALGKPVVQICAASHDALPFMVRNRETLLYEPGRTYLLVDALVQYLEALLERAPSAAR
jgi:hypothetical protein